VGVNLNPKSAASQFVADMEANEKIFWSIFRILAH
jgi:hypothetical protein